MDIEKAKESCKAYIDAIDTFGTIDYKCINNLYEPIKTVLSELEKKEAIINEMAEYITYCFNEDEGICKKSASEMNYQTYNCDNNCNKCIKQHFTKKVEKEGIKE